jgi:hypothetical protein
VAATPTTRECRLRSVRQHQREDRHPHRNPPPHGNLLIHRVHLQTAARAEPFRGTTPRTPAIRLFTNFQSTPIALTCVSAAGNAPVSRSAPSPLEAGSPVNARRYEDRVAATRPLPLAAFGFDQRPLKRLRLRLRAAFGINAALR